MKSIGILYICTGPYCVFWKDFYESFEKHFLLNMEKRYFVFTDSDIHIMDQSCKVKVIKIENQPWPLITLLRFHTFLKVEEELLKCDYLMYSNANIICNKTIKEDEFLPNDGQRIFVTKHPGYYGKSKLKFPYERNPRSKAYIPWNCGENYVIGAMFGGTSQGFLKLTHCLAKDIEEDLKKNVIASWHDESHLNHYILGQSDVKVLPPDYCHPCGMKVDYEKKIYAVNKQDKFDVKAFKGQYKKNRGFIRKCAGYLKHKILIKEHIFYVIDFLCNKKIS